MAGFMTQDVDPGAGGLIVKVVPILLVLSALLAGCAAPKNDPVETAAAPGSPGDAAGGGSATSSPSASSSSASGAPAATSSATASGASAGNATTPPVVFPVALKGTIPAYAEACASAPGYFACEGEDSPLTASSPTFQDLPGSGKLTGGALKVTFTGADAMGIAVYLYGPGGFKTIVQKSGPSPLEVTVPAADVLPTQILSVRTFVVPQGADLPAGGAWANPTDTTFELTGALTMQTLATGPTHQVVTTFAGSIPTFVEPCAFPAGCTDLPPGVKFQNNQLPVFNGTPLAANLTLAWTAASPTTEKLSLSVYAEDSNHVYWIGGAYGASPLKAQVAKVMLPAGWHLRVHVGTAGLVGAGPAWVGASPADQAFTLTGTWTLAE